MKISYDVNGNNIADSLGVEGTVNYATAPSQSGTTNSSAYLFRVDAIYSLFPKKKWNPFAVIGLGEMLVQQDNSHEQNLLLNYGVGVKYMLEEYLALRVEARYLSMYSSIDPRSNFELSTGLTYIFGKEHKKKTPPAPLPTLKAIPDIDEKTLLTPPAAENASELSVLDRLGAVGPAVVGLESTPEEFQPIAPPPPPPTVFSLALRPELRPTVGARATAPPKAEEVPAVTAALTASAATPVPGAEPATPPRAPAQAAPVAPKPPRQAADRVVQSLTVQFDFNSSTVSLRYAASLAAMAKMVRQAPAASIRIVGHTDSVGEGGPNLSLSLKRATSLKNQLVSLGVNAGQISAKGAGFTQPVASNLTSQGRQLNRRAVATVVVIGGP